MQPESTGCDLRAVSTGGLGQHRLGEFDAVHDAGAAYFPQQQAQAEAATEPYVGNGRPWAQVQGLYSRGQRRPVPAVENDTDDPSQWAARPTELSGDNLDPSAPDAHGSNHSHAIDSWIRGREDLHWVEPEAALRAIRTAAAPFRPTGCR